MPTFFEILKRNLALRKARTTPGAKIARDAKVAAVRAEEAAKVAESGSAKIASKETPEKAAVSQQAAAQARDAAETAHAQAEQAEFAARQGKASVALAAKKEAEIAAEQAVVAAAAAGIGQKPGVRKRSLVEFDYVNQVSPLDYAAPAGKVILKRGKPEMPPGPSAIPAPGPTPEKISTQHMYYGRPINMSAIAREKAKADMIVRGVMRNVYDPNRKAIRTVSMDEF